MRRAGLAVAGLPLVLVPAWAASPVAVGVAAASSAAEQPLCDPATVPTSEALADATVRVNAAHQRMNVDEAHSLATGEGVKVAVVDSGIAAVDDFPRTVLYELPGTGPRCSRGTAPSWRG